jgi:hypothetical protein
VESEGGQKLGFLSTKQEMDELNSAENPTLCGYSKFVQMGTCAATQSRLGSKENIQTLT